MPQFTASTITMDVPDEIAAEGAEAISEWINANAPDGPALCAQCSGWGKTWSLDLGDFEPSTHDLGEHNGTAYVTKADGEPVT